MEAFHSAAIRLRSPYVAGRFLPADEVAPVPALACRHDRKPGVTCAYCLDCLDCLVRLECLT